MQNIDINSHRPSDVINHGQNKHLEQLFCLSNTKVYINMFEAVLPAIYPSFLDDSGNKHNYKVCDVVNLRHTNFLNVATETGVYKLSVACSDTHQKLVMH